MRIVKNILHVIIIILFIGCCLDGERDVINEFIPDELSWQIYNLNDTLVFENQYKSIKKYIINSIKRDSIPEDSENLFRCKINNLLVMEIDFSRIINSTSPFVDSCSFYMEKSSNSFNIFINWEGTGNYIYGSRVQDNIGDTLTIDGLKYTDIFICNVDTTLYPFELYSFYYSKTKGMIQFDSRNGDVWVRKF